MASELPLTRSAWQDRLATLPGSPEYIPSFFYGHGSPLLAFSRDVLERDTRWHSVVKYVGPEGPLAHFLLDFGPALLAKYQPKGILVFSAHWEGQGEQLGTSVPPSAVFFDIHPYRKTVTDYGDENPLLMDYEDFDPECYTLKFNSRGDATLSRRVVQVFQNVLPLRSHNLFSGKPRRPLLHRLFLSIGRYSCSFDGQGRSPRSRRPRIRRTRIGPRRLRPIPSHVRRRFPQRAHCASLY